MTETEYISRDGQGINAYLALIVALLQCPNGQENEILAANQELIDARLVQTIIQAAVVMHQKSANNVAQFLFNLANQLAAIISYTEPVAIARYQEYLHIFLDVFSNGLISNQGKSVAEFYLFLEPYQDKLDSQFQQMLQVWATLSLSNSSSPEVQAIAGYLTFFGALIKDFPQGNKENNIEIAITALEITLDIYQQLELSQGWAAVQIELGIANKKRIQGDKVENIEIAINCYKNALKVYHQAEFPEMWAKCQYNIGLAYLARIQGNEKDNVKAAISSFKNALQVYTQDAFPQEFEKVSGALYKVYQFLYQETLRKFEPFLSLAREVTCAFEQDFINFRAADSVLEANLDKFNQELVETLQKLKASIMVGEAYISWEDWKAIDIFSLEIQSFEQGNLETNLDIALSCLEILSLCDFEQNPELLAVNQYRLGQIYYTRYQKGFGDAVTNQEQTIQYYQKALEVEVIHSDSQNKFRQLLENSELAAQLEQISENSDMAYILANNSRISWANIQRELGRIYHHRISGDKSENEELAIAAFMSALQVYTAKDTPREWGETKMLLGVAYQSRCQGVEAENLEIAVSSLQAALSVLQNFPELWAVTQHNLASVYTSRILGDEADNLDKAIEHCNKALQIHRRENFLKDWGIIQITLGNIYYKRGLLRKHLGGEDLEISIQHSQNAAEVYTRENHPQRWSDIQHNLGITYSDRIFGDKAENLEKAQAYLQAAIEIRQQQSNSYLVADSQRNLAIIRGESIHGRKDINFEKKIEDSKKLLEVTNPDKYPNDWAEIHANLGGGYKLRVNGDRRENLENAIFHYNQVLTVITRETNRKRWSSIQFELGTCYKNLGYECNVNQTENLEKSIECYQNALRIIQKEANPFDWAEYNNSLGNAYKHRILGTPEENNSNALACYQNALQVFTRQSLPRDYIKTLSNIGSILIKNFQISQAYELCKEIIDTVESLRSEISSGTEAKRKLAEEYNLFYQSMVFLCYSMYVFQELEQSLENSSSSNGTETNNYFWAEAWDYAERSKARNLVELLENQKRPIGNISQELWNEIYNLQVKISNQRRIIEDAEAQIWLEYVRKERDNPHLELSSPEKTQLNQLQQQYERKIAQAKSLDPLSVSTQKIEHIPYGQFRQSLPDDKTAVIEWYLLETGFAPHLIAFVFTRQSPQPFIRVFEAEDRQNLEQWQKQYLTEYNDSKSDWQDNLQEHLKNLAEILHLEEILTLIPEECDCDQIILIPHRYLHQFPLHALPLSDGNCLIDKFSRGVRYAPSCQALFLIQNRERPNFEQLFAIQNPTQDLEYAEIEVQTISKFFNPDSTEILSEDEANKENVTCQELLRATNCLHFSCHGIFNPESPLKSCLFLANQDTLTLDEIFGLDLDQCQLVVLSACETGMTDLTSMSDEYIGLPNGFLYAGSPSIVASQWTVDDISTALLMIKFYENYVTQKMTVAVALNQAQIWLRDITKSKLQEWITANKINLNTRQSFNLRRHFHRIQNDKPPFNNPYYWAAFCAIGK